MDGPPASLSASDDAENNSTGVFDSSIVSILVGGKVFNVHLGLFKNYSIPLYSMISTSGMKESVERKAVLRDISSTSFERVLTWMYEDLAKSLVKAAQQKYSKTDNVKKPATTASKTAPTLRQPPKNSGPHAVPSSVKYKKRLISLNSDDSDSDVDDIFTSPTRLDFLSAPYRTSSSAITLLSVEKNNICMSNAEVYIFADQWLIEELKQKALQSIHHWLIKVRLEDHDDHRDLLLLLKYLYARSGESSGFGTARHLMKIYLASVQGRLKQDKEFQALMIEDRGTMLEDFMEVLKIQVK